MRTCSPGLRAAARARKAPIRRTSVRSCRPRYCGEDFPGLDAPEFYANGSGDGVRVQAVLATDAVARAMPGSTRAPRDMSSTFPDSSSRGGRGRCTSGRRAAAGSAVDAVLDGELLILRDARVRRSTSCSSGQPQGRDREADRRISRPSARLRSSVRRRRGVRALRSSCAAPVSKPWWRDSLARLDISRWCPSGPGKSWRPPAPTRPPRSGPDASDRRRHDQARDAPIFRRPAARPRGGNGSAIRASTMPS